MKTKLIALTLLFLAGTVLAGGPMLISVEKTDAGLVYGYRGTKTGLQEVRTHIAPIVRKMHSTSPDWEFRLQVVPNGPVPTEDLMPLFLCLKRIGVKRCTLNLSHRIDGQDYWIPIEIELKELLKTKADRRREMLKRYGIHTEKPNQPGGR